jgi:hypothetical protein
VSALYPAIGAAHHTAERPTFVSADTATVESADLGSHRPTIDSTFWAAQRSA